MQRGDLIFRCDRRPGDDELIVQLHRLGYAPDGERFGAAFCAFVAQTVAEARLDDPRNGRVWFVEQNGEAYGCAAMIARGDRGQLRWVVLRPELRGLGTGRRLFELALDDARQRGFREVYLETTDGLDASMAIYEQAGFRTVSDKIDDLWHGKGRHIVMTLDLAVPARAGGGKAGG